MKSAFTDKTKAPTGTELQVALGDTYSIWQDIEQFTLALNPGFRTEWKHSGEKFGWGYRISDKKRVIIYLLPRQGFFKVAFVFGQKATDTIMQSGISQHIKDELANAKAYAEGRGIRLEVKDHSLLDNLEQLIRIKIG